MSLQYRIILVVASTLSFLAVGCGKNPPPTLSSLTIATPSALYVGTTQQLAVSGTYSDKSTKDVTSSVTWSSSTPAVAAISSTGLASGLTIGQTTITAALSGASGTLTLSVVPAVGTINITELLGTSAMTSGGAVALLDNVYVGPISAAATLSVQASPGSHLVTVLDPAGSRGDATITVGLGTSVSAQVSMLDSDAIFAPGSFVVSQIQGGVFNYLDKANNPIIIQYSDAASTVVPVTQLAGVFLSTLNQHIVDLSSYSTILANGSVSIDLKAALATLGATGAIIETSGPFELEAHVLDAHGTPFAAIETFDLGLYNVQGVLKAPPSNPSLSVSNVAITLTKHSSSTSFTVTSDAGGRFSFSGIPGGEYDLRGSVTAAGIVYNIFGSSVISANATITAVPLGPVDLAKQVGSVTTQLVHMMDFDQSDPMTQQTRSVLAAQSSPLAFPHATPPNIPSSSPYGAPISTSANQQGVPMLASGTYTISKGTSSVALYYQVCSQEYPYYVDEQSQYNDLWSIESVDGSGNSLVNASANVNEQLTAPPVWQGSGCTAVLQPSIDVSASTANGSANIIVSLSATNIGDSLLPTSVQAIIAPAGTFSISSFKLDPFTSQCSGKQSLVTSNITLCGTGNSGDYISIPSLGPSTDKANTFMRPATAILQYPANDPVTVTNVQLDIVDLNGNVLDTLFNEPPGTYVQISSENTLKFSITYPSGQTPANTITSASPERISYLLTVKGSQGGTVSTALPYNLTVFNTLWAAADSGVTVGRYSPVSGPRDLGGDDWATVSTIAWMKANASLLTSFNDISGEHGRYLEHLTHGKGTDIDIFQFSPLNTTSGTQNYIALSKAAALAAAGDAASLTTVANFITANRTGIDNLNATTAVLSTRFGIGTASGPLATGWLKQAMQKGTLLLNTGAAVDLKLGAKAIWTPSKSVSFDAVHNNHIHISL